MGPTVENDKYPRETSLGENILFPIVVLFIIPLISVLWLKFILKNQLEGHQNRHFLLIWKNYGMGRK